MLIKYGETNVTDRLLDYKMSVSFADCRMIGNVPSIGTTSRKSTSQTEISLLIQLLFT